MASRTHTQDARRVELLLSWYSEVGRELPWRTTRDPYAVLVSEIMLQQTQVSRVLPRYNEWLRRWPTAEALATAPTAEVLAAWSGLGYNSRALRLQAAAQAVVAAGWPTDEPGLRALPGVGPYTAAAIAAFALRQVAAAVDTNQQRVLDRWDGAPGRAAAELRARALGLVPDALPDLWNHALMDLGATICTARAAHCDRCPMVEVCESAGAVDPAAERAARMVGRAPAIPFEQTARYVRGRIVALLVERGSVPRAEIGSLLPEGISPERVTQAIAGLVRDGLIERNAELVQLPSAPRPA